MAAASLVGIYSSSEEAIAILRTPGSELPRTIDRDDVRLALCESLWQARRWSDLLVEAPALAKNVLYGPSANRFVMDALFHLGRWDDMERAAATKNDRALVLMKGGKFEEARRMIGVASDPDLSAWNEILAGRASASSQIDGVSLYTQAMSQLLSGELQESQRSFNRALTQIDSLHPPSPAWLIHGELLKAYGIEDGARSAFENARRIDDWGRLRGAKILLERELGR